MHATRQNAILHKLGLATIRPANHFEQRTDEYGTRYRWAIDRGALQSRDVYTSIGAAFADLLICALEDQTVPWHLLTPKEHVLVCQATGLDINKAHA